MTPCDNLTIYASAVFWQCHFEILRVHPNMLTSCRQFIILRVLCCIIMFMKKRGVAVTKKKME